MNQFGPGLSLAQMPAFIPGLELCGRFYADAVRPILARRFRAMPHAAALLDEGSDVLGFDTPLSRDHGWGPRCTLFVREPDHASAEAIRAALADELPLDFYGYPTNFNNWMMAPTAHRPINHLVRVTTVARFFREYVGVDATGPIEEVQWLALPAQRLRTIQSGAVFHDDCGELTGARRRLAWCPPDLWLYLLACQWRRIEQEEPFMARCGDVGDELGSRLLAARQVQEIMRLCFLIERAWPPYSKWFAAAFSRLNCAADIAPLLRAAQQQSDWPSREEFLLQALAAATERFNALGLADPLPTAPRRFYDRPYRVLAFEQFSATIRARITSPAVRRFPEHLGAVWQFADSTDVLDCLPRCAALAGAGLETA